MKLKHFNKLPLLSLLLNFILCLYIFSACFKQITENDSEKQGNEVQEAINKNDSK
jgi:type III secretory pathway lipoprotein EscJ